MQNSTAFIDSAKVMAKGQVTIPADVRKALGVGEGDRVSFVVDGNNVRLVNAAVFAMQMLQKELGGEAQKPPSLPCRCCKRNLTARRKKSA